MQCRTVQNSAVGACRGLSSKESINLVVKEQGTGTKEQKPGTRNRKQEQEPRMRSILAEGVQKLGQEAADGSQIGPNKAK